MTAPVKGVFPYYRLAWLGVDMAYIKALVFADFKKIHLFSLLRRVSHCLAYTRKMNQYKGLLTHLIIRVYALALPVGVL